MNETMKVLLGVIALDEAKRLRNVFESKGVRLELVSNPGTCAMGSCGATVELYADEGDVATFEEFVAAERARMLEGLTVPGHAHAVFDQASEHATCPACGTEFKTTAAECPDCGLGFAQAADETDSSDACG